MVTCVKYAHTHNAQQEALTDTVHQVLHFLSFSHFVTDSFYILLYF